MTGFPRKFNKLTVSRLREVLNYDRVSGVFTWRIRPARNVFAGQVAGCLKKSGYISISIDGIDYLAHRLAWLYVHGVWPKHEIDHKHGKEAGNGIDNLREATDKSNAQNRRSPVKGNKSGFLGVYWQKRMKCWTASIGSSGKTINLGCFSTPEEASNAYIKAKRALHDGCII